MGKLPYRTIVYIDGFNFYYGQVRDSPWKWLDPVSLFQKVLGTENKLVKKQHQKLIGLVTPGAPHRKTSRQLRKYADFVKPIRTWALQASQLPNPIPGTNIHKPVSW